MRHFRAVATALCLLAVLALPQGAGAERVTSQAPPALGAETAAEALFRAGLAEQRAQAVGAEAERVRRPHGAALSDPWKQPRLAGRGGADP